MFSGRVALGGHVVAQGGPESGGREAVAGSTRGPLRSSGPWVVPRRKMRASSALVVRGADDAGATVEGADADGSACTTLVLRGDSQVVKARREACRPRKRTSAQAAEEALLAEERSGARPTVDVSVLDADLSRASLAGMGCEKSAEHLRGAERAWDEFAAAYGCVPPAGGYPDVQDVKRFAASMTRTRKRACLAQREREDEPARAGVDRTSSTNWLRQVRAALPSARA